MKERKSIAGSYDMRLPWIIGKIKLGVTQLQGIRSYLRKEGKDYYNGKDNLNQPMVCTDGLSFEGIEWQNAKFIVNEIDCATVGRVILSYRSSDYIATRTIFNLFLHRYQEKFSDLLKCYKENDEEIVVTFWEEITPPLKTIIYLTYFKDKHRIELEVIHFE